VIFVDNQCLRILKRHHNEARSIIGKPLTEVLGIDADTSRDLLTDIDKFSKIEDWHLEIRDSRGTTLLVMCSAVATRDDKGKFVGADLQLRIVTDVAEMHPGEDFDTVEEYINTGEEQFLRMYFEAQIDALFTLLLNWAGQRVARYLEVIINETGERNVWPVAMNSGHITIELKQTDTEIFRALLAKAVVYAVSVIGDKQVIKEMQAVNKAVDPPVYNFVQKLGLHELFQDILR